MNFKKSVKLTVALIIAIVLISIGTTAFAVDTNGMPEEIYSMSELENLFLCGGYGILMDDIDEEGPYQFNLCGDVILDMNGHSIFYWGDDSTFYCTLLLFNSDKNCEWKPKMDIVVERHGQRGVVWENHGTIVCLGVDIRASDIDQRGTICMIDGNYDISYDNDNNGIVINLKDTYESVTLEDAEKIAFEHKLPELKRNGYEFVNWTQNGNEVTELPFYRGNADIKANWSSSSVVTFDPNGGKCEIISAHPDKDVYFTSFPSCDLYGYCFDGWILPDGKKATTSTKFNESVTLKASWVLESERNDKLSEYMKEQGFSEQRIKEVTDSFNSDEKLVASVFSKSSSVLFIGVAAVILIIAGTIMIKKKKSKEEN